jgi:hypothetical protein
MSDDQQQWTIDDVRRLIKTDPEAVERARHGGQLDDLLGRNRACPTCGQVKPQPGGDE